MVDTKVTGKTLIWNFQAFFFPSFSSLFVEKKTEWEMESHDSTILNGGTNGKSAGGAGEIIEYHKIG